MKKGYLIIAAIASVALVSCSNEEFVGEPQNSPEGGGAISFNLMTPAITRGEKTGKAAATDLGNQFIIWGEKNEINAGETNANVTIAPGTSSSTRSGDLVFENYIVRWTDNSAYTTTSNTKNWEYVGFKFDDNSVNPTTENYSTYILPNTKKESTIVPQAIKYWDYNASSYTFTAVSALSTDISSGKVKITKITSGSTVYDKGYEIAVNNGASLGNIFVADRNNIAKTTGTDRTASNAYGGNVKMTFRNFNSKIRFGLYENIHGYKVNITNVEYNSTGSATTNKFGVDGKFLAIGDGTTTNTVFTVKYDANNKAIVTVKTGGDPAITPGTANYLETAQSVAESPILSSTAATPISTTSASPTWDKTDGAYTMVLPYPSNTTSMKVKLDFTLTSEDTGEEITVVNATAEIPASYCQWQSNYAYTYLLKINDNTNGQIGGVTGLYPITFDAVVVTEENTGDAEYITTVSEPSITTFGVKDGKYSIGGNEYAAGTNVYATVMDGGSLATLNAANMKLYTVTADDANFPATSASVAEALIEKPTMNAAQVTAAKVKPAAIDFTAFLKVVPGENGVDKTLDADNNKAAYFTVAATTKYALVYEKTPATYYVSTGAKYADATAFGTAKTNAVGEKLYSDEACTTEAASWANASTTYYQINGKTYTDLDAFNAAGMLYKDAACTEPADATYYGSNTDATYYKPTRVKTQGVYAIKIVNP